jgi:flavin-dependent dehydrogenase
MRTPALMMLPDNVEVLVVGGGPAGLAAAIAVRNRGFEVAVADAALPPIDKACGEGVMPDGVAALRSIGVIPGFDESFPFHGIRFREGTLEAEACFPEGPGLGIRREVLHRLLIERAAEAGVMTCWGAPVTMTGRGQVQVGRQTVRCRWLLGADGQNSRVRRSMSTAPARITSRRYGFRQHLGIKPWTDMVEVYWQPCQQAYVTPVGPREICLALIGTDPRLRMRDLAARFPELGRRLKDARIIGPLRGGVSLTYRVRRVVQDRLALVGDASGSVDALTGEGLSLGFRQALAVADALARNDLGLYQSSHRRICRVPRITARLLLTLTKRDRIRRRAIAALSRHPKAFAGLMAVQIGALPPAAIGFDNLARFACALLNPLAPGEP